MELARNPLPTTPRRIGRPSDGWDRVADGQTYIARQGRDFSTDLDHFRGAIYSAAARREMRAVVHVDKHARSVTFRFFSPDQEGPTS